MHPYAALFALLVAIQALTCSWVFLGGVPSTSSSCQPPPVTFSRPGPKRVTLTVCAGPICNSHSETIEIFEARPRISRIAPLTPTYADETLTLTAEASGKPPLSYTWKLPDGSLLSGNPVAVPRGKLSPTASTIRLTVSNVAGTASRTVTPKILSPAPRVVSVTLSPNPAYPGTSLSAAAEIAGRPPFTLRWTFPDGKTLESASPSWTVPHLPARSHPVLLDVSNASGSASTRRSLRVLPPALLRGFEPVCPGPCIFPTGRAVEFTISTTATPPLLEIDWNGDGTYDQTVTSLNPTHAYDSPGFFRPRARLRLENGRFEIRSSSRVLTITR